MSLFALVDCNNFYASCERVFNPALAKRPVVILSNNDGCVVSRSNESKALGIPMGAPFFQWKEFCQKNKVFVFSSNYELYGDMSARVMRILEVGCPDIEVYSIDEAFLPLHHVYPDLSGDMITLRKNIFSWTGIPVSIGIAPTRTLAKVAGHFAKKQTDNGVFDLRDKKTQDRILSTFPVEEIWGVGRKLSASLKSQGITTAKALRDTDMGFLRQKYGVIMTRICHELQGVSCLALDAGHPRQQIMSSRSFGRSVTALDELAEAVSHYTAIACCKLRAQGSLAGGIRVFIRTSPHHASNTYYENNVTCSFPLPTASSSEIIAYAKKSLEKIFKPGYHYKKAGVMLFDLSSAQNRQIDLFAHAPRRVDLSETVDRINKKMGRTALMFCAEGIERTWKNRNDKKSLK